MTVTVTVVDHPVVVDALARIRDVTTPNALFRQNLERIGSAAAGQGDRDAADGRDDGARRR